MTRQMTLMEIVTTYRPETHGNTRGRNWTSHSDWLWANEKRKMRRIKLIMSRVKGWVGTPVNVHDGVVQDAHHRLCIGMNLGLYQMMIPVEEVEDD